MSNRAGKSTPDAIGLFSRALAVSQLGDKVVLLGLGPVALPAFAAEVQSGRSVAAPYLRALTYISGMQWPALLLTALLAQPLVLLLLGPQWLTSVPLVRILAVAAMALFAAPLTYPILVTCGAIRHARVSGLFPCRPPPRSSSARRSSASRRWPGAPCAPCHCRRRSRCSSSAAISASAGRSCAARWLRAWA